MNESHGFLSATTDGFDTTDCWITTVGLAGNDGATTNVGFDDKDGAIVDETGLIVWVKLVLIVCPWCWSCLWPHSRQTSFLNACWIKSLQTGMMKEDQMK